MFYDRDKYTAAARYGLPLSQLLPKYGADNYWWCTLQSGLPGLDFDDLGFVHICPSWCTSSVHEKASLIQLARSVMEDEATSTLKYTIGHYGGSCRDDKHVIVFGPCDVTTSLRIGDTLANMPNHNNVSTLLPEYMIVGTTDIMPDYSLSTVNFNM